LALSQTNKFDPPPRPRVKLVEWHLTAQAAEPAAQRAFVALLRPHRANEEVACGAEVEAIGNGYLVRAALREGQVLVGLRTRDGGRLTVGGLAADGDVVAVRTGVDGKVIGRFAAPVEE
jgi:hypothetical protein